MRTREDIEAEMREARDDMDDREGLDAWLPRGPWVPWFETHYICRECRKFAALGTECACGGSDE